MCWEEARADDGSANTYVRVTEGLATIYRELDEDRGEVRRVEMFDDGRSEFAEDRGGAELDRRPVPTLEALAADPRLEVAAISRTEFEAVWDKIAYADVADP